MERHLLHLLPSEYRLRRASLVDAMGSSGVALFLGNSNAPMNYAANHYWFKQDSSFRYFFGVDVADCAGMIDLETGKASLFGPPPSLDAAIWEGEAPSLAELAAASEADDHQDIASLPRRIAEAVRQGRHVHYLPPYRAETSLALSRLVGLPSENIAEEASPALVRACVQLREVKSSTELAEMERALEVTQRMHLAAMRRTRPGVRERDVVAAMEEELRRSGITIAYPPIFTSHGEVLHSTRWDNELAPGQLVVNDSGACSREGYASDITRTLPVSGRFTARQREIYEIVLRAQAAAMDAARPGAQYLRAHDAAALVIAEGMAALGFFKGDAREVVASGAYAICFPHGVGHQIGLDVHDMESLGEDRVGYDASVTRSSTFGPNHLRMAKALRPGMVVTVEPGIYFIGPLVRQWKAEGRFTHLVDYTRFEEYIGFGGIRIEDDVVITRDGCEALGPPIPKSCAEVEDAMNSS